jgi:hypothetical protein
MPSSGYFPKNPPGHTTHSSGFFPLHSYASLSAISPVTGLVEVSGNENSIHWRVSQFRSPLKGTMTQCSESTLDIQSRSLTVRQGRRPGKEGALGATRGIVR